MPYFMYLRKSRKDIEAEMRGEGETLARHRTILYELAERLGVHIEEVYQEVVSGDTIAARPQMQRLLSDIETGTCDGVFVMEIERLARGDTIDQGIVAQTFKYSNTKIITPIKTYDPANAYDEEYFEFGLFMSRREFTTIKRRLSAGKLASVKEGKYIGNKPPYGYDRKKLDDTKGYTLVPNDKEAPYLRAIFDWYVNGCEGERLGTTKIAHRLNKMNAPTRTGGIWTTATIQGIIRNPVYIGKIRWYARKQERKLQDGNVIKTRPRNSECVLADGLHEAIIPLDTWNRAQEIIKGNRPTPVNIGKETQNPLAGIVVCGKCGRKMRRRPYANRSQEPTLLCPIAECENVSAALSVVECKVISSLEATLSAMVACANIPMSPPSTEIVILKDIKAEIDELSKQQDQVRSLLEQQVYTVAVYLDRNKKIENRMIVLNSKKVEVEKKIREYEDTVERRSKIIPQIQHVLNVYWDSSPSKKNEMLKSILEKAVYTKDPISRWKNPNKFSIELFLRF